MQLYFLVAFLTVNDYSREHILNNYYVSDTILNVLPELTLETITRILWTMPRYYPHFAEEET